MIESTSGTASEQALERTDAERCHEQAGQCQLCGDDAVVGRVLDLDERARTATVAFENGSATVALDLVDAAVGDEVLVHLGFAIERVEGT